MTQVIVFKNEDGGVSVATVVEEVEIEDEMQKFKEKGFIKEDKCAIIDSSELPDVEFRDAWEWVE